MNILLLIDNLGSGGAQRQIVTIAKLLKDKGVNVSFLVYGNAVFFEDEVINNNINIEYILTTNYLKRILKVRKFVRKNNFQTVISFLETPNFLNCIAAIGGKKWKVITNERSSKKSTFLSYKGKVFGWFQRYSDSIVCNSNNAKKMWEKYYPQYRDKLSVVYNPVILPKIKSEYSIRENGKTNIVVAASYQYLKNPIGLVKALLLLSNEEKSKIKISWYGKKEVTNGDTRAFDEVSKILSENPDINDVISLYPETKTIIEKMQQADVVALFSELEGLPNAICEGMMIGKPIIMSRVSDYSILVDKTNGLLCDWDDINSIKEVLSKMIFVEDDKLLSMGEASKEKAKELFLKENIINQWMDKIE